MSFLVSDDSVRFINSEQYKIQDGIPVGIYKLSFSKFTGSFLEKTSLKLTHGKIYGNSEDIAKHIVESYKLNTADKNLGVLLSGDRGLGKTLTTRLVIEKLVNEKPVIVVSEYTPDLPDFFTNVKNCVILMDEFEKFMGGNANGGDNDNDQTKQETLLSILDGNTGCSGNLFLLTVNNTYKLDENLLSRPGRIRYHYKYTSETANVVRGYCEDNLLRKEITEEVVKTLGGSKYVSMDIISSFVDELNKFPQSKPEDVIKYFNIESQNGINYTITITASFRGKNYTYNGRIDEEYEISDGFWINLKNPTEIMNIVRKPSSDRSETEEKTLTEFQQVPPSLRVLINEDDIPSYIYGTAEVPVDSVEVLSAESRTDTPGEDLISEVSVGKVVIKDNEWKSFSKKYAL